MNIQKREFYNHLVGAGLRNMNAWMLKLSRLGFTDSELNEIDDELFEEARDMEEYERNIDEFYRGRFHEWKEETENKGLEIQISNDKIDEAQKDYANLCVWNQEAGQRGAPYWLRESMLRTAGIDTIDKKIRKYKFVSRVKSYCGEGGITSSEIDRARQYQISDIYQSKKGYINCPFHDDQKGKMYIKNNFGYCFVCGKHADPIDLMMESRKCDFVTAVRSMQ